MSENLHMRAQQLIAQQRVDEFHRKNLACRAPSRNVKRAPQSNATRKLRAFRSMNSSFRKILAARTQYASDCVRTNCQRTIRARAALGDRGFPGAGSAVGSRLAWI